MPFARSEAFRLLKPNEPQLNDKFQLKLLDPTDRYNSQENSRRVLEKLFSELHLADTEVSLKTAHHQFFSELSTNSN
jgi:hypothetical protein